MAIQLAKKRAGKRTSVKMSEEELRKFASTKHAGLPVRAKAKKQAKKKAKR